MNYSNGTNYTSYCLQHQLPPTPLFISSCTIAISVSMVMPYHISRVIIVDILTAPAKRMARKV